MPKPTPTRNFCGDADVLRLYPSNLERKCPEKYDFFESQVVPRMNFWKLK